MGSFSGIFKMLRIERELSQAKLAEKLGVSKSAVSMYERGEREPDFRLLEKIADYFNVDIDYLLGHSDKKKIRTINEYEPTYEDIQSLIARNGKGLSVAEKQEIIRTLLLDD